MTETRIDRLLTAIELIEADERDAALVILRDLIREDADFEDAWLWMSVTVDSIDRSVVCLDNVLRINPNNQQAAAALYRLRADEIARETRRERLKFYRDTSRFVFWLIVLGMLIITACGIPFLIHI